MELVGTPELPEKPQLTPELPEKPQLIPAKRAIKPASIVPENRRFTLHLALDFLEHYSHSLRFSVGSHWPLEMHIRHLQTLFLKFILEVPICFKHESERKI